MRRRWRRFSKSMDSWSDGVISDFKVLYVKRIVPKGANFSEKKYFPKGLKTQMGFCDFVRTPMGMLYHQEIMQIFHFKIVHRMQTLQTSYTCYCHIAIKSQNLITSFQKPCSGPTTASIYRMLKGNSQRITTLQCHFPHFCGIMNKDTLKILYYEF